MKHHDNLTEHDFDALLAIFSPDRDEAGEHYERIRSGLVRFFQFKGCADPEQLTDETINRVAAKIDSFDRTRNERPVAYFYGFASKVLLEYRRIAKREFSIADADFSIDAADEESDEREIESECLQKCLQQLPTAEKNLIVEYYSCEGQARMKLRKKMSERNGCSAGSLHTKVFRLRAGLRTCIGNCLKKGS